MKVLGKRKKSYILVTLFLLSSIAFANKTPTVEAANDSCTLPAIQDNSTDVLHLQTLSNSALDPDERGRVDGVSEEDGSMGSDGFEPEQGSTTELKSVDKGIYVSEVVENDTAWAIELNLTTGRRYTFCVTIRTADTGTSQPADVYLLETGQFETWYSSEYLWMRNDEGTDWLKQIPPEMRSMMTWKTFRDVHEHEKTTDLTFSVALDKSTHQGTSSSMFGDSNPEVTPWISKNKNTFTLVIDAWDNNRENDAPPPGEALRVDLTILAESQSTPPPITVTLVCGGLMIGLLALPIIAHFRYHRTEKPSTKTGLIQMLTQEEE